MTEPIPYKRIDIAPFAVLGESWRRIADQYWLFLGVAVTAVLGGSLLPLGVLMGPLMCGLYACYRDKWQGRPVEFETLFSCFESFTFVQSLIATVIMMGITMVFMFPIIFLCVFAGVIGGVVSASRHTEAAAPIVFLLAFASMFVVIMAVSMAIGIFFAFTYPLILDRRLDGIGALRLSARAAWANLWGMVKLGLAVFALGMCGVCLCYVGAFLVMPVSFGAFMIVYDKVFGLTPPTEK